MSNGAPAVFSAITSIIAALGKEGIAKDRRNTQQGYNFRGIDDIYNALSPLLAQHQLVIVPRMLTRDVWERETKAGNALFYVVVTAEFDFVSAADGSMVTARTFGEGMDSADKATNKAMSAAYKYAAFQTFAIPTEAVDSETDSHDVKGKGAGQAKAGPQAGVTRSPNGMAPPAGAPRAGPPPVQTNPNNPPAGPGAFPPSKSAPPREGQTQPSMGPPPDYGPPPEGAPVKPTGAAPAQSGAPQREPRKRPVPSGDSEIDAIKMADLSKAINDAPDEATLKFAFLDAYQFAADVDDDRVGKSWQLDATKLKDERKRALGIK